MKYALIILLFLTNHSLAQFSHHEMGSPFVHRLNIWDYASASYYWQHQINKTKSASIKSCSQVHWQWKSWHSDTIRTFYNTNGTLSDSNYTFDSQNRLIWYTFRMINIGYDSIPDTTVWNYHLEYLSNRIIVNATYLNDTFCLTNINFYDYNERGLLIRDSSISQHKYLPHIAGQVKHYLYTYDALNRPISMETISNGTIQRQEYIYTKHQKIIRDVIRDQSGFGYHSKHPLIYYDQILTYDSLQRLIKSEAIRYDPVTGKKFKPRSGFVVYNEFGYDTEIKWKARDIMKEYTFDPHGNPLSIRFYRKFLGIFRRYTNFFVYTYEYY